jgi:hypothetical protein
MIFLVFHADGWIFILVREKNADVSADNKTR